MSPAEREAEIAKALEIQKAFEQRHALSTLRFMSLYHDGFGLLADTPSVRAWAAAWKRVYDLRRETP